MRRLVDTICTSCGEIQQDLYVTRNRLPGCGSCGGVRGKVWLSAPGLSGLSAHYSHALGRNVTSYTEEERELAKKGSWIASKSEVIRSYDQDLGNDVVIKKARKEQIRKQVDKQAQKLVADGRISFGRGSG